MVLPWLNLEYKHKTKYMYKKSNFHRKTSLTARVRLRSHLRKKCQAMPPWLADQPDKKGNLLCTAR